MKRILNEFKDQTEIEIYQTRIFKLFTDLMLNFFYFLQLLEVIDQNSA